MPRPSVKTGVAVSSGGGGHSPAPAPSLAPVPTKKMPQAKLVKSPTGQPSLYSPQIHAAIVDAVREGMPVTFAAHLCRVAQPTVSRWLDEGEADPASRFNEFALDIRQAQAEFVQEAIRGIKDSGLSDAKQWTALMTLLERIYPEHFRRPGNDTNINVGVNVGVGVVEERLRELHDAGEIVYDGG